MRLGHVGLDSLQSFGEVRIIERCIDLQFRVCEHCVLNNKTKIKFGTTIHRMGGFLDCVHINIWSPTKTTSLEGHRYFIFFVDDLSRWF